MKVLKNPSYDLCTNRVKWSNETIIDSTLFRAACGKKGINILREKGLPGPCLRTLQRHISHITFKPGIQEKLIIAVGKKVNNLNSTMGEGRKNAHYAIMCFDEMTLRLLIKNIIFFNYQLINMLKCQARYWARPINENKHWLWVPLSLKRKYRALPKNSSRKSPSYNDTRSCSPLEANYWIWIHR